MRFEGEYYYDQDLGFLKKAFKAIGKVGTKVSHAVVPRSIRKLVPNELKGATIPLAVAGGYGLAAMGGGSMAAGAGKVGGTLARAGGAVVSGAKTVAPFLAAGASQIMQAAPQMMESYGAIQQQQMQAQLHDAEMQNHLEQMRLTQQHNADMARLEMMRAQASVPQAFAVGPAGSGGAGGAGGRAPGGLNINPMILAAVAGGGVLLYVMNTRGPRGRRR